MKYPIYNIEGEVLFEAEIEKIDAAIYADPPEYERSPDDVI